MSDITRIPSRGLQRNLVIDLAAGSPSEPSLRINHLTNEQNYDHPVNTGIYSAGVDAIGFTLGGLPSLILKKEGNKTKAIIQNAATNNDNVLNNNEELGLTVFGDIAIHGDLYTRGKIRADNLVLSSSGFNNYTIISKQNLVSLKQDAPAEDGQIVFLVCRNNIEDGEGGFYIWRASSTKPEDLDGLTVISNDNTSVGRYELVSFGKHNPFTIYVAPDSPTSSDSKENSGNNPERPFRTILRACVEVARRFCDTRYNLTGTERFTIVVETGNYIENNSKGVSNPSSVTPNSSISDLNSPKGGIIIPRGTSIIGRDLRKVIIRPNYVPDPTNVSDGRSCIFRMTGGVFFANFTFRDKINFNQSHHKLSCFEFLVNSELADYYQKVANWFGIPNQYRSVLVNNYETNIVTGSQDFTFKEILNDASPDNTVDSASPYIFSCSVRSVYGLCGILGDAGNPDSPDRIGGLRSYLAAQFTVVSLQKDPNAFIYNIPVNMGEVVEKRFKGTWVDDTQDWRHFGYMVANNAYAQLVSCFCIGTAVHYWAKSGGEFSITNSTSNFGDVSLLAEGYRTDRPFIQDTCYKAIAVIPPKKIDNTLVPITLGDINTSSFVNNNATTGLSRQFRFKLNNLNELRAFYENGYSLENRQNDITRRRVYLQVSIPSFLFFNLNSTAPPSLNDLANNSSVDYISGFRFADSSGNIIDSNPNGMRVELSAIVEQPFTGNKVDIDTFTLNTDLVISNLVVHAYWDSNGNYITSGGIVGAVLHELNNFNISSNPSRYNQFLQQFREIISSSPIIAKRYIDKRSNYEKLYKLRISYPTSINYGGFNLLKKSPEPHYVLGVIRNFGNTTDDVTIDSPTYELGQSNYNSNSRIFVIEEICKEGTLISEPSLPLTYRQLKNVIGFLGASNSNLLINNTLNQGQFDRYVDVIIVNANRARYNAAYKKYPFYNKEVLIDSITKCDLNTEIYSSIDVTKDVNGNRTENFLTMQDFLSVLNSINPINNLDMTDPDNPFAVTNDSYDLNNTAEDITNLPTRLGTAGYNLVFKRPSIIRCSGQTWEYMGNYNYNTSIPQGQIDYAGISAHFFDIGANKILSKRLKEISKIFTNYLGGNVYVTGMDDRGRFFIGQRIIDTKINAEEDTRLSLSIRFGNSQVRAEFRSREFDNLRVNNSLIVGNNFSITPSNLLISQTTTFTNTSITLNNTELALNNNSIIALNSQKFISPTSTERQLFEATENKWGLARAASTSDVEQALNPNNTNKINRYVTPDLLEFWVSRRDAIISALPKKIIYVDSNFYDGTNRGYSAYWSTARGLANSGIGTVSTWSQFMNRSNNNYGKIITFSEFMQNFSDSSIPPQNKFNLSDRDSANFCVFASLKDAIDYGNYFYGKFDTVEIRLAAGIYPVHGSLIINFGAKIVGCNQLAIHKGEHPYWLMSPIVNDNDYDIFVAQGINRISDYPNDTGSLNYLINDSHDDSSQDFDVIARTVRIFNRTYEYSPVFKPENAAATTFDSIKSVYNNDFNPKHTSIICLVPFINRSITHNVHIYFSSGKLIFKSKAPNTLRRVVFLDGQEIIRIRNRNLQFMLAKNDVTGVNVYKTYNSNTPTAAPNFLPSQSFLNAASWNVNMIKYIFDLTENEDYNTNMTNIFCPIHNIIECYNSELNLQGVVFGGNGSYRKVINSDRPDFYFGSFNETSFQTKGLGNSCVLLDESSKLNIFSCIIRGNCLFHERYATPYLEYYSHYDNFVGCYSGKNSLVFENVSAGLTENIILTNYFGQTYYYNTNYTTSLFPLNDQQRTRAILNILPPNLSSPIQNLRFVNGDVRNTWRLIAPVFYSFITNSPFSEIEINNKNSINRELLIGTEPIFIQTNIHGCFGSSVSSLTNNISPVKSYFVDNRNPSGGIKYISDYAGQLNLISVSLKSVSNLNNFYQSNRAYTFIFPFNQSGFLRRNGSIFTVITASSDVNYDFPSNNNVFFQNLNINYTVGDTTGTHTLPAKTVLGHFLSMNIEPSIWPFGMFYGTARFRYNQTLVNDAPEVLFSPIGGGSVREVTTYLSKEISNPYVISSNIPQFYVGSYIG